jgi:hypothetical protein
MSEHTPPGQELLHAAAELSEAFVELFNEQLRDNAKLFEAVPKIADLSEVGQLQGDYMRSSLERLLQFNDRYYRIVDAILKGQMNRR